ncbi:hypothetical protein RSP03_02090 [Cereibacter sphaeroides]|jgi:hypothetical protein|nr:hypothetical protein RSP03_02090 [Cereibacter sphaeroides]
MGWIKRSTSRIQSNECRGGASENVSGTVEQPPSERRIIRKAAQSLFVGVSYRLLPANHFLA